jgi:hypothetical protein
VRFVIHAHVLNGDDSVLGLLDRLVDRVADEVHLVDIPELDLLQESSWYQKARPTRQKVVMSALARPPRAANDNRGPHTKTVDVLDAASAGVATRLAYAPLVIIVEDRESDGAFLDIIVEELGEAELKTLWTKGRQVTPRALEIDTAGGKGSIPQRVARAASDAAEEGRPHRLFVLCDSDARWPGDGSAGSEVSEICAKHGVPFHILRKRCAENYIPDRVFEVMLEDPRHGSRADHLKTFLRLSREERDHFPVRDGLCVEERSEALKRGIYASFSQGDLKQLENRLFPRRPRVLVLLKDERRDEFTAEGLRARDGEGELEALLYAIAVEL